ncbi:6-phosphogluconate dehydrogenase C-terminal domain-like protein [Rhizodiscina lignyota]|uniref:6-phosphogluconate dehydrogenase C-terminal domain-like protein n=1 Tax=Rhizodiscina lignyota TaxID=1504668 RepID=A0A9P4IFN9_9PEZI|nr:6-phosphogluconate dehydrogenase C-terminal domain-like protein [Rhizodiscina lignyota]
MAANRTCTIAIISVGEMGLGIGQLLKAHKYRVATYAADRSKGTQDRAFSAGIELLPSLEALFDESDYLLSIVPPRDALSTANRIALAASKCNQRKEPLYYLDLNAVSPRTARETEELFRQYSNICLIDGGIIGGVPYQKKAADSTAGDPDWHCPSLMVSGPTQVPDQSLAKILNVRHVGDTIGPATGLKMCFAVTTKGFISLAIESFVTAHRLGVLPELKEYLGEYNASTLKIAEKGLVTMPPKAYRWVGEMLEISRTMHEDGGFDPTIFEGVSEVYRFVADESELGKEKPGARVRGKTVEDVVELLSQAMEQRSPDVNKTT